MDNISTVLKTIKDSSGMSQVQLAYRLGVSQPTVNRILAGQTDCKGSTFQAIMKLHDSIAQSKK